MNLKRSPRTVREPIPEPFSFHEGCSNGIGQTCDRTDTASQPTRNGRFTAPSNLATHRKNQGYDELYEDELTNFRMYHAVHGKQRDYKGTL